MKLLFRALLRAGTGHGVSRNQLDITVFRNARFVESAERKLAVDLADHVRECPVRVVATPAKQRDSCLAGNQRSARISDCPGPVPARSPPLKERHIAALWTTSEAVREWD